MALTEVLTAVLRMDSSQYQSEARAASKSTKGISEAAQDAGSKGGKGISALSGQVKKLGGLAAGAFAAKAVVDFARGAINSATELEESVNAVDVVFEAAAASLKIRCRPLAAHASPPGERTVPAPDCPAPTPGHVW